MSTLWLVILSAIAYITNAQSSFYHTFNVLNDFIESNNTFNIKSTIDTQQNETLNITFSFINGRCWNPKLSLSFEEIDFDSQKEFFFVYYPEYIPSSVSTNQIGHCSGNYQYQCGYYSQCINNYELLDTNNGQIPKYFEDGEIINLYILKSGEVNAFCDGFSLNMNITISCSSEHYHLWNEMTSDNGPTSLYGHIAAYYEKTLTFMGGIHGGTLTGDSPSIYTRTVTPYSNTNATGGKLRFKTGETWSSSNLTLPSSVYKNSGLFCDSQCYTQINDYLWIYGAYNTYDNGRGVLLKYHLKTSQFANISRYRSTSPLVLNHACVTSDNMQNIFIISGKDKKSIAPYIFIQKYDTLNDKWDFQWNTLYRPTIDAGCIVANEMLYIFGGWIKYQTEASNLIEKMDINTGNGTILNVTLESARVGHRVLKDNKDRLWIIGGRDEQYVDIPDVEIFDTNTQTMISKTTPIKYASTIIGGEYSAPWYDSDNDIMFTSGGYDGTSIRDYIQYIAVDIIGTDAYPTPPPTPPPVPTPYPTPNGYQYSKTFDMSSYTSSDSISITQSIQSTEDLGDEDSFFYLNFKFINGMCTNASISFKFEEIDFAESYQEYLEVYYPTYPGDIIAHCTGSQDWNCGTWLKCLDRMTLDQPQIDTSDNSYNYLVSVLKSAEINAFCTYSINANVTIHCGPRPAPTPLPTPAPSQQPTTAAPTTLYTNFTQTFDLLSYDTTAQTVSFTIPVQSNLDTSSTELIMVDFIFKNGECNVPRLSITFEEASFAYWWEYIEIYYPSYPSGYVTQCSGQNYTCGVFSDCVKDMILRTNSSDLLSSDEVKITLLKSWQIYKCGDYAINANVTITCGPPPPTSAPTLAPTDEIFSREQTFDLTNANKNVLNKYTINVHSSEEDTEESIWNVTWKFINGDCYDPYLSVIFEEIDHDGYNEYLEIRYPTFSSLDAIGRCDGDQQYNCDNWEQCMTYYDLALMNISKIEDEITVFIVKSAEVNAFCGNSINANLTITCIAPNLNANVTCPPTPICTPSPTNTGQSTTNAVVTSSPTTPSPTTPLPTTPSPTAKPTTAPICAPCPTIEPTIIIEPTSSTSTEEPTPARLTTTSARTKTDKPTSSPIDCNNASTGSNSNDNKSIMDYLPWILLAASGFFNLLLLLALIQQCRFRKSIERRHRALAQQDNMQMVTMNSRAGYSDFRSDFQEITSDASVDYVTMAQQ